MNIIHQLINDSVMNALGWSIIHILWQGTVLALISGVVLFVLRHKSSKLRYFILLTGLFLFVGLSVTNFMYQLENSKQSVRYTVVDYSGKIQTERTKQASIDQESGKETLKKWFNAFKTNIDRYFPMMISLWIAGVILFTLKFVLSYFYTTKLKFVKKQYVTENWQRRFDQISKKLNISKTVRYFESHRIKIPMVLGHFKPIILIPAEMLTGIPSDQIEAIMAHELAHIRRNDYIINVLQTLIETLFFFHPGVWYISGQLRKERENCCDDLALTVCSESIVYAKALVSIQELTFERHYSAVAFSGNKKHLLNRIKRMIMKPKVKNNFTDKIIAAFIILAGLTALSFTYAAELTTYSSEMTSEIFKAPPPSVEKIIEVKQTETLKDTVRVKIHHADIDIDDNTIIKHYDDEKGNQRKMKFTLVNGKATDLYVDGKRIPEKDYDQYQPEIDETIEQLTKAKANIQEAMIDLEDLDLEKIQMEVEKAMEDVEVNLVKLENIHLENIDKLDIDLDKVIRDFEKGINELNLELEIEKELEKVAESLKNMEIDLFDFDEFAHKISEIEKSMEEIDRDELRAKINASVNSVDVEKIISELNKTQKNLSHLQKEEILYQMERMTKNLEPYTNDEKIHKMEEALEELEKLELEEK